MSKSLILKFLIICSVLIVFGGLFWFVINKVKSIKSNDSKSHDLFCAKKLSSATISEISMYKATVKQIVDAVLNGHFRHKIWYILATFTDKFGNRIAGSENLEKAIDYVQSLLEYYELENVHGENVSVPYWVR